MKVSLKTIEREIVRCRACPRLVRHRESVAVRKRRRFREWTYWGRPVPSFGDPKARLLIVGLAPAAHGGNRTGRIFTGDRSGDWLFEALHRAGFANQPASVRRGDGLALKDCYITAVVHCAPPDNKPSRQEISNCRSYLLRELKALKTRVVVALGKIAFDGFLAAFKASGGPLPSPRPAFGHGKAYVLEGGLTLIASYHPSQQNTLTGRLTRPMLHAVFRKARRLLAP